MQKLHWDLWLECVWAVIESYIFIFTISENIWLSGRNSFIPSKTSDLDRFGGVDWSWLKTENWEHQISKHSQQPTVASDSPQTSSAVLSGASKIQFMFKYRKSDNWLPLSPPSYCEHKRKWWRYLDYRDPDLVVLSDQQMTVVSIDRSQWPLLSSPVSLFKTPDCVTSRLR